MDSKTFRDMKAYTASLRREWERLSRLSDAARTCEEGKIISYEEARAVSDRNWFVGNIVQELESALEEEEAGTPYFRLFELERWSADSLGFPSITISVLNQSTYDDEGNPQKNVGWNVDDDTAELFARDILRMIGRE